MPCRQPQRRAASPPPQLGPEPVGKKPLPAERSWRPGHWVHATPVPAAPRLLHRKHRPVAGAHWLSLFFKFNCRLCYVPLLSVIWFPCCFLVYQSTAKYCRNHADCLRDWKWRRLLGPTWVDQSVEEGKTKDLDRSRAGSSENGQRSARPSCFSL